MSAKISRRQQRVDVDTQEMRKETANPSRAAAEISLRRHFDQYLSNATLHGLRFIGDRQLTWFER